MGSVSCALARPARKVATAHSATQRNSTIRRTNKQVRCQRRKRSATLVRVANSPDNEALLEPSQKFLRISIIHLLSLRLYGIGGAKSTGADIVGGRI
ncbi:MAG: hypothetical protein DRI79_02300 [Chloroflexi bacterium]|nr:MAG: hypothetical protein DRI79_02300 [Chloroflexota bacterium]